MSSRAPLRQVIANASGTTPHLHLDRREFLQMIAFIGTAIPCLRPASKHAKTLETVAPHADLALAHIADQMDSFHNRFAVFSDPGAPGNHFFALTKIGDIFDAIGIEICSTEHVPPTGNLASIKSRFQNITGSNFGGWYFLNGTLTGKQVIPSPNFGTVPNAGVDLRGATRLSFWARGEQGGEQIEFFLGGVGFDADSGIPNAPYPDSTPRIPPRGTVTVLTQQWQQYVIDVSKADLSYLLGGFGWVAAARNNPNGAIFWVSNIQYDKTRFDAPRFIRSYVPLSVDGFDLVFTNAALTFDNSLAILALLARGHDDDMRRAKLIGEAFLYAQANDPYYRDGRLRNAYQAGDLIVPPGWTPNGNAATVNLPVIVGCSGGLPTQDMVQVSSSTGSLAWAVIAMLALYRKLGDSRYKDAAIELTQWITGRGQDSGIGGYKAGFLGFDGSAVEQQNANTSDNLAVYAALTTLAGATGEQGWQKAADVASSFVRNVYDPNVGCLLAGAVDSHNLNRDYLLIQDQALSVLALPDVSSTSPGVITCAQNRYQTSKDGFKGFDANDDRDGIWFAGTAMMAAAYRKLGDSANSEIFLQQLRNAQASALNANGKGLVEASHNGITTGFSSSAGQPVLLYSRLHLGTTALYALTELEMNPCYPFASHLPLIVSLAREGKNLIVFGQNFGTGAGIVLNGEPQKTSNDMDSPSTRLIGKKVGKKIRTGDKVKVRNADGSESNEVIY
jgi:hypothetical protein